MKSKFWISFIVLFIVIFTSINKNYAQSNFEGKITFKIFNENGSQTMDYFVKGDKIRFETQEAGGPGQIILDGSSKQVLIIMPNQKMYMVTKVPESKMKNGMSGAADKNATFTKTGETKKILGYTAEKITYKDDEDQGEAWVTRELGTFKLLDNPMQTDENSPQWQKDFNAEGYFPLEVVENGKTVFEITGIDKKSLDNSMFEAPADYKKMEMPMMHK
jgi:hypothetical protein